MKAIHQFIFTFFLCISSPFASGGVVTFGNNANTFSIIFSDIGSPGNAPDTTGELKPVGAVSYDYSLSTYEISRDMILKSNAESGLGLTLVDMSQFGGNGVNRPATHISWIEAAKFVNWLNSSHGFQVAYKFDALGNFQLWSSAEAWQQDGENLFRHKDSHFWLPSAHEWYKAAFYSPITSSYFDFATGSNVAPIAVTTGTAAGTSVYNQTFYQGPADIMSAGGPGPFGVVGLGGNVTEWVETVNRDNLINSSPVFDRLTLGGAWYYGSLGISSSTRESAEPTRENGDIGFRVAARSTFTASVPEPALSTFVLVVFCTIYIRKRLRGVEQ